jgi:IPT/TIG domain/Divergent InlB B-repeat domain/PASTA domain
VRRTRKAPSVEPSQRQGSRLGLLVAIAVLALLLVPVAQASAAGTMHVKVEGSGSGEVSSVGGIEAFESESTDINEYFDGFGTAYEGSPPIECSGPPPTGTCETALVEDLGPELIALHAVPAAGSEFIAWTIEEGEFPQFGCEEGGTQVAEGENPKYCLESPEGGADVRITAVFSLVVPPAVTEVKPAKGPLAGGNLVEIVGTGLAKASKVEFGSTEATIESATATLVKVQAPAHAAGTVPVTVTTPSGTSPTTAADEYTYVATPALTEVSPASGPTPGGNTVELTGTDLGEAKKVEFGSTPAVILEDTPTKIKVKAPVHPAGVVDVTVTTAGGSSAPVAASKYTYVAVPAITGIAPAKGAAAGGTDVEITGLNLAQASEVKFGAATVPKAQFEQNTATTIKLKSPPGTGVVDVRVVTVGGTSGLVPADKFTYLPLRAFTVTVAGTGSGSVTCNGGACAAGYTEGTSVTLAAGAGAGSTFAGWSGGGCSGTGGCVVTVNADTAVTATFTKDAPPPPPLAEEKCVVPKLKGMTLGKAKSALTRAHCKAGKVSKPKKSKGALVVKSSKPTVGTVLPAGSKVNLKLAPKPQKKGKK